MKLLPILFAGFLLITPSAQQESPELKVASDLTESVVKLINDQKYGEALSSAKRALEIRERLLPRNDPRIGNSLIYLIHIYDAKRDYAKARETLERLLQYQTDRFGSDNVKLAPTLARLAVLYFRDGDKSRAEAAYQRAVALKEKEYGPDHVEVAHTLFGLAQFYRALRDFDRASPVYRRTIRIYAKHSSADRADLERTIEAYGCLGYETNKDGLYAELRSMWLAPANSDGSEADFGTILNGKALSLPKPPYPVAARAHGEAGTVVVKVTIDESGKVVSAKDMCGGPQYISKAALEAAYAARFTPTTVSGNPIRVTGQILYNFVRPR